jgi:signal transduction histidine kinase
MTITMVIVSALALVSAGALIWATTTLQRNTGEVVSAVDSIRLIEEAEINLLLLGRTADATTRHHLESDLHQALAAAGEHVATLDEARAMEHANALVEELREARRVPEASPDAIARAESQAFAALEQLVDINLAYARAAYASSVMWDRIASVTGIVLGMSIIAITAGLALWLRRQVLRPLLGLADTVKRFGEGERTARSDARGPLELREMSQRFNEMADALKTQREAQIAFLGGIAHDLRTPLSALRIAVDIVGPDEPLPPEAHVRHVLSVIGRQIDRLERMTHDLLDLSKIEAGKLELDVANRDLRPIARHVAELFEGARRRIDLHVAAEPVVVACDEVRIGQAITNLVSNALKYSPETERVRLDVRADGEAVIEVVDHGVGIPEHDHRTIFEPFRRRDTKSAIPGTGLGLFNVKRIVEAHGGRIEVESVPSRGSTFRIRLPLALTSP